MFGDGLKVTSQLLTGSPRRPGDIGVEPARVVRACQPGDRGMSTVNRVYDCFY